MISFVKVVQICENFDFILNHIQVEKHPEASQRLNVEAAGNLARAMRKYLKF